MTAILVLLPAVLAEQTPALPASVTVSTFASPESLGANLAAHHGPCVIVSDALAGDALDGVAAAVKARTGPTIEVRSQRWDGTAHSALSAACRGVISGFGADGVNAAVALLLAER